MDAIRERMENDKFFWLRVVVQFIVVGFLIGAFVATLIVFENKNDSSREKGRVYPPYFLPEWENDTTELFLVDMTILSFNIQNNNAEGRVVTTSVLDPPSAWSQDDGTVKIPYVVVINEIVSSKTVLSTPIRANLPIPGSNIAQYPFDEYKLNLTVSAFWQTADLVPPYALRLNISQVAQYGWEITYGNPVSQNYSYVNVEVKFTRTNIFRLYPVFMMIALWCVTFSVIYYGSSVIIWERKNIDPPLVAFTTGLLFVLPGFRNTAPFSPGIGCLLDFAAFYWAIVTVVITASILIGRFTWLGKPAPAAPKPAAPAGPPK